MKIANDSCGGRGAVRMLTAGLMLVTLVAGRAAAITIADETLSGQIAPTTNSLTNVHLFDLQASVHGDKQ